MTTPTSRLALCAKAIADAVETARGASAFSTTKFSVDWDFENRRDDTKLAENTTVVRVLVPLGYELQERMGTETERHVAAFYVDVRRRVPQANDDKATLDGLAALSESLHDWFVRTLSGSRVFFTYGLTGYAAQWCDKVGDHESKAEKVYSTKFLKDSRQYYGWLREVFEMTPGTA